MPRTANTLSAAKLRELARRGAACGFVGAKGDSLLRRRSSLEFDFAIDFPGGRYLKRTCEDRQHQPCSIRFHNIKRSIYHFVLSKLSFAFWAGKQFVKNFTSCAPG